jgi:hypothetical protein
MTTFDDRERGEEAKFQHDQELAFKVRNRRNKLFGLWIAQDHLGLSGEAASSYAKDVVMSDFEAPGDSDMMGKIRADLAKAGRQVSDHMLQKRLAEFQAQARQQVMSE